MGPSGVRLAPAPVVLDGQALAGQLRPKRPRGVSLEELLLVELGDVVGHRRHAARLRPADGGGSLARRVEPVPQGLRADWRVGAVAEMLERLAACAVEHQVAEHAVARGRDAGDDRRVTRPRDGGEDGNQPPRAGAAGDQPAQRGERNGGVVDGVGAKAVDAQHDDQGGARHRTLVTGVTPRPQDRVRIIAALYGQTGPRRRRHRHLVGQGRRVRRGRPLPREGRVRVPVRGATARLGGGGRRPLVDGGAPDPLLSGGVGGRRGDRGGGRHRPGSDAAGRGRRRPPAPSRDPVAGRAQRGGGGACGPSRRARPGARVRQSRPRLLPRCQARVAQAARASGVRPTRFDPPVAQLPGAAPHGGARDGSLVGRALRAPLRPPRAPLVA